MSKRVQRRRVKGWRLPEDTIIVDRSTKYGNPFKVEDFGREEALRLYRIYLDWVVNKKLLNLSSLTGKNLACTCKPSEDCHADILLEYINRENRVI